MLRKRLNLVLGLLAAAALVWALAPALSTARYIPDAVDFSQPLPEIKRTTSDRDDHGRAGIAARHAPSEVRWKSGTVVAPRHFDFVGVAGTLDDIDFRVRESGGEWSEWVTVTDGNPLFTGGSDEVQVRSDGPKIEGELHYVNVSGTDTAPRKILNKVRGAVNSGVISALTTPIASATSPEPNIISRSEWGADGECEPRTRPAKGEVRAAVIHHTVSSNTYSEAQAPGMVLGICRYHRNANGWNDIGYNALVDRFGNIYEGRAGGLTKAIVGAQAEGINSQTTGVALIGNQSTVKASRKAKRAITKYLSWKLGVHGIPARRGVWLTSAGGSTSRYGSGRDFKVKRIFGHGTANQTECPGSRLAPLINKIKRRVAKRMDRFPDGTVPPPRDGGIGGS